MPIMTYSEFQKSKNTTMLASLYSDIHLDQLPATTWKSLFLKYYFLENSGPFLFWIEKVFENELQVKRHK